MVFFKATPNLSDDERSRIEFHLQQIADCIGFERFKLPVANPNTILYGPDATDRELQSPQLIKEWAGKHLDHEVEGLKLQTFPMVLEKVGGGG